ncbi:protein of unknown function (plasmid) [Cupriavidus taiwanensis]|uniref:Uncharacterized protein n=1 Tax=Cupriavidus taiwanensis TaxID=164546 RepID=A0A375IT47_9BURK|nr:protein of unknown function [Cupriavidus taiwanensis]
MLLARFTSIDQGEDRASLIRELLYVVPMIYSHEKNHDPGSKDYRKKQNRLCVLLLSPVAE